MTCAIHKAACAAAAEGTRIHAVTSKDGPAAIEGPDDGAAALPGLFAVFDREMRAGGPYDGVIIACFDDTGLAELKSRSPVPVLGIGEAAFHAAMMVGGRFSVVTTLAVSVPVIESNIADYGFAPRCAGVRASGIPVLDLDSDAPGSGTAISEEIERAVRLDQSDCIVLGCAGMAGFARNLSAEFGIPVVDGVSAAIGFCETLYRTSLIPRSR